MKLSRSEIEYNQILQRVVSSVEKDIRNILLVEINSGKYTQDSWITGIQMALDALIDKWSSSSFKRLANQIASRFVRTTVNNLDRHQKRSFGLDVLQNSPEAEDLMRAAAIQNAQLIKSIPEQYLNSVSNIVLSNMRTGLMPREIAKQLEEQFGITQRRARFIARDQTAKVNGELTERRQRDAGYEYFKWLDSDDQRVRKRHQEIANADVGYGVGIYRWDDLPKSDDGTPIKPGQDYGCRCTSRPIRNSIAEQNKGKAA